MVTITAAEASRNFSAVLGRAESGETIAIVRHGRTVATITPPPKRTGRALRAALENSDIEPFDDELEADIKQALSLVTDETEDPWGEA